MRLSIETMTILLMFDDVEAIDAAQESSPQSIFYSQNGHISVMELH